MGEHVLDNPVLSALTGTQADLAEAKGVARRFPPDVSLFAALPYPPEVQRVRAWRSDAARSIVGHAALWSADYLDERLATAHEMLALATERDQPERGVQLDRDAPEQPARLRGVRLPGGQHGGHVDQDRPGQPDAAAHVQVVEDRGEAVEGLVDGVLARRAVDPHVGGAAGAFEEDAEVVLAELRPAAQAVGTPQILDDLQLLGRRRTPRLRGAQPRAGIGLQQGGGQFPFTRDLADGLGE